VLAELAPSYRPEHAARERNQVPGRWKGRRSADDPRKRFNPILSEALPGSLWSGRGSNRRRVR
jgi:hypothetical protein